MPLRISQKKKKKRKRSNRSTILLSEASISQYSRGGGGKAAVQAELLTATRWPGSTHWVQRSRNGEQGEVVNHPAAIQNQHPRKKGGQKQVAPTALLLCPWSRRCWSVYLPTGSRNTDSVWIKVTSQHKLQIVSVLDSQLLTWSKVTRQQGVETM